MASEEDNICELLGLNINKTALEIVKADFKRKKIPFTKASKHLVSNNPNSTNSSAAKSFNASMIKAKTKALQAAAESGASTTPNKRSRIDSSTFG